MTLNICIGSKFERNEIFARIYLAFDFTFPSQAEGKVMTLNIYEVITIFRFVLEFNYI